MESTKRKIFEIRSELEEIKAREANTQIRLDQLYSLMDQMTDLISAISQRVDDSKDYEELEKRVYDLEVDLDKVNSEIKNLWDNIGVLSTQ